MPCLAVGRFTRAIVALYSLLSLLTGLVQNEAPGTRSPRKLWPSALRRLAVIRAPGPSGTDTAPASDAIAAACAQRPECVAVVDLVRCRVLCSCHAMLGGHWLYSHRLADQLGFRHVYRHLPQSAPHRPRSRRSSSVRWPQQPPRALNLRLALPTPYMPMARPPALTTRASPLTSAGFRPARRALLASLPTSRAARRRPLRHLQKKCRHRRRPQNNRRHLAPFLGQLRQRTRWPTALSSWLASLPLWACCTWRCRRTQRAWFWHGSSTTVASWSQVRRLLLHG